MQHYLYGAAIGLVSILAIAISSWLLHRLDRLVSPQSSVPWWKTWKRMALLAVLAFFIGIISTLSTEFYRMGSSLFLLSFFIIPLVYRHIEIGIWAYRLEQLAIWSAWGSATVIFGGPLRDVLWFSLLEWLFCGTLGAMFLRNGFNNRWRLADLWWFSRPLTPKG